MQQKELQLASIIIYSTPLAMPSSFFERLCNIRN